MCRRWVMLAAIVVSLAALAFVMFLMVRSIRNERSRGRSIWGEFGLGIPLTLLFFVTWLRTASPNGRPIPTSNAATVAVV